MRSSSVQFRGVKQVLNAYVQNDMPGWSLWWSPRDLMAKYEGGSMQEGKDQLEAALNLLTEGGSEASYMLRVYEDLPKGQKINSATPYSGSFNFGLFDYQGGRSVGDMSPYQQRQSAVMGQIDARFQELQDKYLGKIIAKMEEDDKEEDEKPSGIMGVIGSLLENPSVQQALMAKLSGWLGSPSMLPAPAQVAGVGEGPKISQEQYDKLAEAVNILAGCDPLIGDHLLELAKIARDNPKKYKMALTFL
jgi:hypothetical protein